jgi:hypothetical protein
VFGVRGNELRAKESQFLAMNLNSFLSFPLARDVVFRYCSEVNNISGRTRRRLLGQSENSRSYLEEPGRVADQIARNSHQRAVEIHGALCGDAIKPGGLNAARPRQD